MTCYRQKFGRENLFCPKNNEKSWTTFQICWLWRVLEAKPMTYMTVMTSGKFHTSTQNMQKTRCFLQKIAELTNSTSELVWTVIPQSFQGYPKSWPGVIGLASSTLQSQHIRKVVHHFRCFSRFFLDKIDFPDKTVTFAYSTSYIFRKLLIWRFLWAVRKHFLSILRGVTFLLTQWDAYVNSILH